MKYIDSEKLIAEIKRLDEKYRTIRVNGKLQEAREADLVIRVLHNLSIIITSLRKEQPEFPTTDKEVEKALASIPKVELPDKYKTPDWLFKQKEQPIKVYRVENEKEQKGLWRKFDGTWEPLFDMLTDGQCKDMPMEDSPIYREGGKQWFASAPSKETLQKWFSKRDLEELTAKGFTISEFEIVGHKKVSDFEYIFTRDNIISRTYLKVSDIYPREQPANMIQWTGNNLKEVIDFTGKSPKFEEWFKSWEEFETYVHQHNDILKLFCEDGSHYEVPVGAWIVKTPDGHNVPSVARFIQAKQEQQEVVQDIANVVKSYYDVQELEDVQIMTTGVGLLNFAEHIKKIILNSAFILYNHIPENSGNKTLDDEIDAVIKMNDLWGGLLPNTLIKYTSRHFAEWGATHLNARKEE